MTMNKQSPSESMLLLVEDVRLYKAMFYESVYLNDSVNNRFMACFLESLLVRFSDLETSLRARGL